MELKINDYPFGARPEVTRPNKDLLKYLGESGIRKLVDDHYELLRKSKFSPLFPQDREEFEEAKLRSSDFFIQVLGGPEYFNQNRGAPKLVNRHANFKITAEARLVWMQSYQQLLPDLDVPEEVILSFWNYLDVFSSWMVNSEA
ncbi:globin [Labilibaculum filiforme]|uniref:Globin n=1 Tax=Labilibaculum filiforme TaxID=1940526 RepID=A0A2N3HZ99_9BACT|nr:globin [Labilibaculum filiforme]PKQ63399.1 globin [Labilibaculum filiforme]